MYISTTMMSTNCICI